MRIEQLLQKVVDRHREAHPELGKIQETFLALSAELLVHMMKEERVLFPFLEEMEAAARGGRAAPLACLPSVELPISRMLADHNDAGVAFLVVHVTLIAMTGFARNMNHIVLATDDRGQLGMLLGFAGIGLVILSWFVAHGLSWRHPRVLQHALKSVTYPMQLLTLNRLAPRQKYREEEISPYFWPNGKMPVREDWKHLAEGGFEDFRLKVGGLVERPVELSLADLEKLGKAEHITCR